MALSENMHHRQQVGHGLHDRHVLDGAVRGGHLGEGDIITGRFSWGPAPRTSHPLLEDAEMESKGYPQIPASSAHLLPTWQSQLLFSLQAQAFLRGQGHPPGSTRCWGTPDCRHEPELGTDTSPLSWIPLPFSSGLNQLFLEV